MKCNNYTFFVVLLLISNIAVAQDHWDVNIGAGAGRLVDLRVDQELANEWSGDYMSSEAFVHRTFDIERKLYPKLGLGVMAMFSNIDKFSTQSSSNSNFYLTPRVGIEYRFPKLIQSLYLSTHLSHNILVVASTEEGTRSPSFTTLDIGINYSLNPKVDLGFNFAYNLHAPYIINTTQPDDMGNFNVVQIRNSTVGLNLILAYRL